MSLIIKYHLPKERKFAKSSKGASGFDVEAREDGKIKSRSVAVVSTGLHLEIPTGYEAQIRSRSGLASKESLFVLNSPGTVDSDYRGEVKIILANFGDNPYYYKAGDRIAQIVFCALPAVTAVLTAEALSTTERGDAGLGSTGK